MYILCTVCKQRTSFCTKPQSLYLFCKATCEALDQYIENIKEIQVILGC